MNIKQEIIMRSGIEKRKLPVNEVLEMVITQVDYLSGMFAQPRDVLFDDFIIEKLSERFAQTLVAKGKLIDFGAILQREARNAVEEKIKDKAFWVEALQDTKTKQLVESILNDKPTRKNS